jgi:aminoglycoside phosphotransferase family enzyme/predicted kinase
MDIAIWREVLQDPAIYPEPTTTVAVHETHISLVFLTDRFAYKLKKPVDLGFLNFSTLERRRLYCEQELTLNRRLSTGVYLEVVSLRQDHQHYTFGEQGEVVEYALKMRRLPDERSLENLLQRNAVTAEMIQALAQRLAAFHADNPLPASSEPYGTLEQVRADWDENFAQTAAAVGHSLTQQHYVKIQQAVSIFLQRHADWFAQRVHHGHIRDCHGDLRAEHIYFEGEQLQIIDCIEFNQRFRFIDVCSEVAFLALDLERLGALTQARAFVRAYVRHSKDVWLYRLLDFYRCYRAYVRGKVTSIRLQTALPSALRAPLQRGAESYYRLAEHYAMRLMPPLLLLTCGLIGSGKSTVARGIAEALGLELLSSDQLRKELAGLTPEMSQRVRYGEGLYDPSSIRRTYEALAELAREVLRRGDSVIIDASFAKRAERLRMTALAREMKAQCYVIECLAPEAVLRERLRERERSSTSISDAREEILEQFRDAFEPIQSDEEACWVCLNTAKSLDACVQHALAAIEEQRR